MYRPRRPEEFSKTEGTGTMQNVSQHEWDYDIRVSSGLRFTAFRVTLFDKVTICVGQ